MSAPGVRTGLDGKRRTARALTPQERSRAVRAAHQLVCGQRLSIRAAQARMAEAGMRRSVGAIASDLRRFVCDRCDD